MSLELRWYPSDGAAWYPLNGGSAAYQRRGGGFGQSFFATASVQPIGSIYRVDVMVIFAAHAGYSILCIFLTRAASDYRNGIVASIEDKSIKGSPAQHIII